MKTQRRALVGIFLTIFLDLVGFGIVIPILPYFATQFGASASHVGWLMTSYSLMQFVFGPIWGKWSDRIGRKPILLLSISGIIFSLLWMAYAKSLLMLFLARFFSGMCSANFSTAYAYVADVTPPEDRAKGMGMVGAAFGLGFIFGPAIGAVLSQRGYSVPFLFAAGLSVVNWLFVYFYLQEPALSAEQRNKNRSQKPGLKTIARVWKQKEIGTPIFVFFLFTLAVAQMETVFALFMRDRYSLGPKEAGYLLALSGLIMVIIQGGAIGKLVKKVGEQRLISIGTLFCAAGLVGMAVAPELQLTVAAMILLGIGHAITHPSLSSLTSRGAAAHERGLVMGVFHSGSAAARVIGPVFAGFSYQHLSQQAPLLSAAFTCVLAFLWLNWIRGLTSDRS